MFKQKLVFILKPRTGFKEETVNWRKASSDVSSGGEKDAIHICPRSNREGLMESQKQASSVKWLNTNHSLTTYLGSTSILSTLLEIYSFETTWGIKGICGYDITE